MDRRDFLKVAAITGAALTLRLHDGMDVMAQSTAKSGSACDLVAVMGGEPEIMFRRAITELGGMKRFIRPGYKVVVKPNIGWDKHLSWPVIPILNLYRKLLNNVLRLELKKSSFLTTRVTIGANVMRTAVLNRQQKLPALR